MAIFPYRTLSDRYPTSPTISTDKEAFDSPVLVPPFSVAERLAELVSLVLPRPCPQEAGLHQVASNKQSIMQGSCHGLIGSSGSNAIAGKD